MAALPARHPLAAQREVALTDLPDLPLRLVSREANPPLADIVVGACRAAGFEPVMGPAFTTDQDTLAAIACGRPSWTVYYETQARIQPLPASPSGPSPNPPRPYGPAWRYAQAPRPLG